MATNNKDFKVKNGLSVSGGGTFGGTVTVATPTENLHAATKQYVDENAGSGPTLSSSPPSNPVQGDQWYDIDNGATYIYYDGYWVEMSSGGEAFALSAASPLQLDQVNSILSIDLAGYATEGYVDNAIASIPAVDLTGYATEGYVDNAVANVNLSAVESRIDDLEIASVMGVY